MKNKVIRNFIYMDLDSLYSLYSQVFEGVAEQITQKTLNQLSRANSVHAPTGQSLDTEVAEASLRTETTILYDHMYNRLEEEIGQAIELPEGLTPNNFAEKLANSFLVKARGKAEIEDYARIKQFTEQFNEIVEGIAYASINTLEPLKELQQQIPNTIQALQASLKGKNDTQRREIHQQIQQLKKVQDPKEFLKETAVALGLRQDPILLSHISNWLEVFYPNGYEITIVPQTQSDRVVFRGILDRKFLRLHPQYLRSLYGGYVNTEWVIVGQVTYLPGTGIPDLETTPLYEDTLSTSVPAETLSTPTTEFVNPILPIQTAEQSQALSDALNRPDDTSPMRDPFRNLFKRSASFDKMFFESKTRVEILLRPLAIYQEVALPTGNDGN